MESENVVRMNGWVKKAQTLQEATVHILCESES